VCGTTRQLVRMSGTPWHAGGGPRGTNRGDCGAPVVLDLLVPRRWTKATTFRYAEGPAPDTSWTHLGPSLPSLSLCWGVAPGDGTPAGLSRSGAPRAPTLEPVVACTGWDPGLRMHCVASPCVHRYPPHLCLELTFTGAGFLLPHSLRTVSLPVECADQLSSHGRSQGVEIRLSHAVCLGFPGGSDALSARTRSMGTIYYSPLYTWSVGAS
jgi:hypothetical protein